VGIFSSDKKTTTNTTNYVTNTQLGIEDVAGPSVVGDNNVLVQTDAGAIKAGEAIALESLSANLDVTDRAGARVAAGFNDALRFAEGVSERERATLSEAFTFGGSSLTGSTNFARDIFGKSLETVTGVLKEGQAQLGNTVSNLNLIARQQSTSSDERIQQIAGTAIKAAGIVAGLFVVGFVISRFAK
jgi:hypothetical protein